MRNRIKDVFFNSNKKVNLFNITSIIVFIIVYFLFIFYSYIIPKNYIVPLGLFIGFAIVIFCFYFFFININFDKDLSIFKEFKFLSEDSIKFILIFIMGLALMISPILNPKTIISWNKVELLNYFRAYAFIIGCCYLPGSNLYNIFYNKKDLHEKFKIESFILKLCLYPLLSLSFLGFVVLILDQSGINSNYFSIFLFFVILGLFTLDLVIKYYRKIKLNIKIEVLKISGYSIFILILSLGIAIISFFIYLSTLYLIPGDSWSGLGPTNYIGLNNESPIEWGRNNLYYPIFWGYIIYALSVLGGLPYININALLAPFCYLYIISLYLLMKSLLYHFHEKYAVLATFLMAIFSGLYLFTSNTASGNVPAITFSCEFSFIYKTFAYLLLIVSLSIFFIISRKEVIQNKQEQKFHDLFKNKYLILVSFFLIFSFMIYALPFLFGILFIIIFCFFSKEKKKNLRILMEFLLYTLLIFILIDILMEFYLSSALVFMILFIFPLGSASLILNNVPSFIFVYLFLAGLFSMCICIQYIFLKYYDETNIKINKNHKITSKKIFHYFYMIFTIFLITEIIIVIVEDLYLNYDLRERFTFFYYLDRIFINIGIIGILGIYLSYYCYKKERNLFLILFSWILISLSIASILILLYWFQSDLIKLNSISLRNRTFMKYWYGRSWTYAVIPLSILGGIGILELIQNIKIKRIFKVFLSTQTKKIVSKYFIFCLLMFTAYTNLIINGIEVGKYNNRINDDEVNLIGWISKNLPQDSNVLMEDDYYIIRLGIESMIDGKTYFIHKIFDSDYNYTELIDEIDYLKDNEIKYLIIHEDFFSESTDVPEFFKGYLIPYFYNDTLKESGDYCIYYAPYFD